MSYNVRLLEISAEPLTSNEPINFKVFVELLKRKLLDADKSVTPLYWTSYRFPSPVEPAGPAGPVGPVSPLSPFEYLHLQSAFLK